MEYRLLVAWDVMEHLGTLPIAQRRRLRDCLRRIGSEPDKTRDYEEPDAVGRPVSIHICSGYAFKYWVDHADRHVKVLDMYLADRPKT